MTADPLAPGRALLLDANLLLVLIVGEVSRGEVGRFKRTRAYSADDYDLLRRAVDWFAPVVVTPHILTEVSNLAGQLDGRLRAQAFVVLAAVIPALDERVARSSDVVRDPLFRRLGLSDAAVAFIVRNEPRPVTVLTDDLDLYLALTAAGADAINFNHLRSGAWGW